MANISIFLAVAIIVSPVSGKAAETEQVADLGNLRRTVAALEAVLDVYRLAFLELAPAAARVVEAGQQPNATPRTKIPTPAAEVFTRLASSVSRRVPARSLDPVVRSYHSEVQAALDDLAAAETLAGVREPFVDLLRAAQQITQTGEMIVDLFSRRRPMLTRVFDPDSALADIAEALDELRAAEGRILAVRGKAGNLGTQLQAFLRLDLALGHALDLIAAAEEAGIHLGFGLQLSTTGFESILVRLRAHMGNMRSSVEQMSVKPTPLRIPRVHATIIASPAAPASVAATVKEGAKGAGATEQSATEQSATEQSATDQTATGQLTKGEVGGGEAEGEDAKEGGPDPAAAVLTLRWEPPPTGNRARGAWWRVERQENIAGLQTRLAAAYACRGVAVAQARDRAVEEIAGIDDAPHVVAGVSLSDGTLRLGLPEFPDARPIYILTHVTPFGVAGEAVQVVPTLLAGALDGPMLVQAKLLAPEFDAPRFYEDADAVSLSWELSHSDVGEDADLRASAAAAGLPVVDGYEVYRMVGDGAPELVATLAAGETHYVDRPGIDTLRVGVRYGIAAVDAGGLGQATDSACSTSAVVRADLRPMLALGAAGLGTAASTDDVVEGLARRLEADAVALQKAWDGFMAQDAEARDRALADWWSNVPEARRRAWLQRWPSFVPAEDFDRWLAEGPLYMAGRDLQLAQAEIWLAANPAFEPEVERWWALLAEPARRAAVTEWWGKLNAQHRGSVQRKGTSIAQQLAEPSRAVQVLAWWNSRDPQEKQRLAAWWREQPPETMRDRIFTWFSGLSPAEQRAVRWPDPALLGEAEREARFATAYRDLPVGLRPHALAWMRWRSMPAAEQITVVRGESGPLGRLWSSVRYALRPLAARFGFRLGRVLLVSVIGLSLLLSAPRLVRLWRNRRRGPKQVRVPTA